MRAGLTFTLLGFLAGLLRPILTHAMVLRAPVALPSAMPSHKRRNVSNLGIRAANFSAATEELAVVGPGTDAMMSDDEAAATAADDEAGSDGDGTRSSEDDEDDDDYEDGEDNEDKPDGSGISKIMSWFQRIYESGSTLLK
jgi:hypothetical protein